MAATSTLNKVVLVILQSTISLIDKTPNGCIVVPQKLIMIKSIGKLLEFLFPNFFNIDANKMLKMAPLSIKIIEIA